MKTDIGKGDVDYHHGFATFASAARAHEARASSSEKRTKAVRLSRDVNVGKILGADLLL